MPGLAHTGIVGVHYVVHVIGEVLLSYTVSHPVRFGGQWELDIAVYTAGIIAVGARLRATHAGDGSGLEKAEAFAASGASYLLRRPQ